MGLRDDLRNSICSRTESDPPIVLPGGTLRGGGVILSNVSLHCMYCGEKIDEHVYVLYPDVPFGLHPECALRMVVGSVGHLTCQCSCYGGDLDDPPGLTRREAALAAKRLWESGRGGFN